MNYCEFRLELKPMPSVSGQPPQIEARIVDHPIPTMIGPIDPVSCTLSRAQLNALRYPQPGPNIGLMQTIGQTVWSSVMGPKAVAAFGAGKVFPGYEGMRFVVTVIGDVVSSNASPVDARELPLEALYDSIDFVSLDKSTPMSRSVTSVPTMDPKAVTLPLRILVVAARATNSPDANMGAEWQEIQGALAGARAAGLVQVDFCDPPTKMQFKRMIDDNSYHVVHFIGHGVFDIMGDDPTPMPYLLFVAPPGTPNAGMSDPVDAETFRLCLNNANIRMVVLSACASAAASATVPSPNYPMRPYDGLAQKLLAANGSVAAVVAMQFDMESLSAVTFSQSFYRNLPNANLALDEVVRRARYDVMLQAGLGVRSWLTPVLFWKCKNGKVFDITSSSRQIETDPATQQKLAINRDFRETFESAIHDIDHLPKTERNLLKSQRKKFLDRLAGLNEERRLLLGEMIRLVGGTVQRGEAIACLLSLRLVLPGVVGSLKFSVSYPADSVAFLGREGLNGQPAPFCDTSTPGKIVVFFPDISQGQTWSDDSRDLAALSFRVLKESEDSYFPLSLNDVEMIVAGEVVKIDVVNGILVIEDP